MNRGCIPGIWVGKEDKNLKYRGVTMTEVEELVYTELFIQYYC